MEEFMTIAANNGKSCKMIKCYDSNFGAYVDDDDEHMFRIEYDFDFLFDTVKPFEYDFRNRCNMAKGFADVTIVLLHELGHIMTDSEIIFDRNETENNLDEIIDNAFENIEELNITENKKNKIYRLITNYYYQRMPDEWAATEWAIQWLNDKQNRKIAKEFEKKFFSCWG